MITQAFRPRDRKAWKLLVLPVAATLIVIECDSPTPQGCILSQRDNGFLAFMSPGHSDSAGALFAKIPFAYVLHVHVCATHEIFMMVRALEYLDARVRIRWRFREKGSVRGVQSPNRGARRNAPAPVSTCGPLGADRGNYQTSNNGDFVTVQRIHYLPGPLSACSSRVVHSSMTTFPALTPFFSLSIPC